MMEPFLHGGCSANIPHWDMILLLTVLLDCIDFYTLGNLGPSAVSSFLHVGPKKISALYKAWYSIRMLVKRR